MTAVSKERGLPKRVLDGRTLDGHRIKLFEPGKKLSRLDTTAYKLTGSFQFNRPITPLVDTLARYLDDPLAAQTEALVIGEWNITSGKWGVSVDPVVAALVSARECLSKLRALFIGDIEYETGKFGKGISSINQGDMTPILLAFPDLEHFIVRGGIDLILKTIAHAKLKSLIIETGGLPASIIRSVGKSDLPKLEYLELWLGIEEYGADWTVKDLAGILSGKRLPKLRLLGLCNSVVQDGIASELVKSRIIEQLLVLNLSMGTLGDPGAKTLLKSAAVKRLKKLDLHHHYISDKLMDELRRFGPKVDLSEKKECNDTDDDEDRVAVSE